MKNIEVLHLASFDGNIGDNASHYGFYKYLVQNKHFKFNLNKLEIREFYWRKRFFDESFVKLVNQYDLLIIGGGNYFELWVENSPTGTSIAIEHELLDRIETPIFFNALGVDPGQGMATSSLSKFRIFLDKLIERGDFISVRNDGALNTLSQYVGAQYLEHVVHTPDAGFFVKVDPAGNYYKGKQYIAINIAADMEGTRFNLAENKIGYDEFLSEIQKFIDIFFNKYGEYEIALVPQIYRDISFISDLLQNLDDDVRRRKITVAPLLHGEDSFKSVMNIYDGAKLVLANRFHSNVCSLGLGTPVIGLVNYVQIEALYREINRSNTVDVTIKNFHISLFDRVDEILKTQTGKDFSIRERMQRDYKIFMRKFDAWAIDRL